LAELIGTAIFVFALDTIVISSFETKTESPKLIMSLLIAITTAILLLAVNPVSGGHMNPAITLAAALVGLISLSRAVVYIFAQCAGAVVGALALKAVVNSTIEDIFSLGGCTLTVIARTKRADFHRTWDKPSPLAGDHMYICASFCFNMDSFRLSSSQNSRPTHHFLHHWNSSGPPCVCVNDCDRSQGLCWGRNEPGKVLGPGNC
jgi:hypothetical protein